MTLDELYEPFGPFGPMGVYNEHALESAIRASTARTLQQCPRLEPLEAQTRLIHEAIQRAEAGGVGVLPRPLMICWRGGRPDIANGCIERDQSGQYRIYLNGNSQPDDLVRTMFHELQHAADYRAGINCSAVELERRAIRFANKMMAAWYGGLQTRAV